MGWTIGGQTGRGGKAKGWILYRLEDEIDAAEGEYAEALRAEHATIKAKHALEFGQHVKRSILVTALWKAQLRAGLVVEGDDLMTPLAESVREAVE